MAGVLAPLGFILMTNERLLKDLQHQASIDPLTQLLNRRSFFRTVEPAISQSARTNSSIAVIAIDIDHFKKINDQFGHQAGDEVLVLLADCLRQHLRGGDIPARFGGEEFVIFLPDTGQEECEMVAERLRVAFKDTVSRRQDEPKSSSISLGLVTMKANSANVDDMIAVADQRLYTAKQSGRDRIAAQ